MASECDIVGVVSTKLGNRSYAANEEYTRKVEKASVEFPDCLVLRSTV